MIIGVDFDNTIADYTGVFYDIALNLGWIPSSVGVTKEAVKSYFINHGKEPKWTELQGIVYGKEIMRANPYDGCLATLQALHDDGHEIKLISHKTKYPIIGEKVDIHHAATRWLMENQFISSKLGPIAERNVFFNQTLDQKVMTISAQKCDVFIDDLERVLNHERFPETTQKVLFNPQAQLQTFGQVNNWTSIIDLINRNVSEGIM
ncbi:hypothetical protein [Pseudoalteromonas piscicida]|uniref:Haloacid dehalogenase-like hydrolase n=1 Tax=Pseudoalteromonas piscicida TaxID=43662 RepID=A0A2A5JVN2_PSEO7|nr:hypothetical protein [Pseudoalteromonas piscicida]PCK33406.1 hypothetical protein CEX98_02610 [Pseudoalteromonas piscicida]